MPIFEYEATTDKHCPACAERFEAFQKITESALEKCPECGAPIHRVISAVAVHGVKSTKNVLSNKNLGEKGFTKYVKAGDGHYEKATGKGPNVIKR